MDNGTATTIARAATLPPPPVPPTEFPPESPFNPPPPAPGTLTPYLLLLEGLHGVHLAQVGLTLLRHRVDLAEAALAHAPLDGEMAAINLCLPRERGGGGLG